ncbi:MAG: 4Fe-4S binding protein [Anaerolineae bacterium]|nr:4Fe-4S binding protein [Anaerolineae bacterium]
MNKRTLWVNPAQCTGCGTCVEICPVNAITLVDGHARIAEEVCTGCGACVTSCPEHAIQEVIEARIIPLPERPAPAVYQPGPLMRQVATTVAVVGTGVLVKLLQSGARLLGQWLTSSHAPTISSLTQGTPGGMRGSGRQLRMRRRGH